MNQLLRRSEAVSSNREIVAVVLSWRGRIGLFKRGPLVGFDAGLWHCVTGFLDRLEAPLQAAARELHEESGLKVDDLESLSRGPVLSIPGQDGEFWQVHTFLAVTETRRLQLNWEHESYRWVRTDRLYRFDGQVAWLRDVVHALGLLEGHRRPTPRDPNQSQSKAATPPSTRLA